MFVRLYEMRQCLQQKDKSDEAHEVRMRSTSSLQVPVLRTRLEEDLERADTHTEETSGQRRLRSEESKIRIYNDDDILMLDIRNFKI